jgi:signal transduction histidine kinase
VVLIDRDIQYWPGVHGWNGERIQPRDVAICGYTILSEGVLEIGDTLKDARACDNPTVLGGPKIRFYAGAPLITPDGYRLGTVCGLDMRPGALAPWQRAALQDLAGTVIDILEGYRQQHRMVTEKQEADRFLALGQLSAGMAHEINNALQPLVGLTDALKQMVDARGRMYQRLETMEQSAIHARDVVADVLAFARQDSGDVRTQDAVAVLCDAVKLVRQLMPAGITVREVGFDNVRADGGRRAVRMSHHGAAEVIQNLVQNAADAMGGRGTVTIRLARGRLDADGDGRAALVVTVSDEAPPIDAAVRARMFDPFFTTKPVGKGSGLGLPTVLGLVEGWGGRLDVATAPEGGNHFMITLPLADTDRPPDDDASTGAADRAA